QRRCAIPATFPVGAVTPGGTVQPWRRRGECRRWRHAKRFESFDTPALRAASGRAERAREWPPPHSPPPWGERPANSRQASASVLPTEFSKESVPEYSVTRGRCREKRASA